MHPNSPPNHSPYTSKVPVAWLTWLYGGVHKWGYQKIDGLKSYLVGGLEHFVFFHSVGNNDPNWLVFCRGVGIPPTSYYNRWFGDTPILGNLHIWECGIPRRKLERLGEYVKMSHLRFITVGGKWYPLVNIQKAIDNGPVEIVSFPMKNGGSFHSYVSFFPWKMVIFIVFWYDYQRVNSW